MSKTIRVTDGVFIALQAIQKPRDSYSDVIERLIKLWAQMNEVTGILGPGHPINTKPKSLEVK